MKFRLLTTMSVCLLSVSAFTQIDPSINGKPEDFKMLKGRKMIVELLEADQKVVDRLTKKGDTADLAEYKNFIATIDTGMKVAVVKYWTLNKNVEYKTESELKNIVGISKDYVILSYRELGDIDVLNIISRPTVPIIAYTRSERKEDKTPDGETYLPPVSIPTDAVSPTDWNFTQASFDFSVRELQADIEWMIKNDKKMNFEDYAQKMSDDGKCDDLKKTDLILQKSHMDPKGKMSNYKQLYTGQFEFVNDTVFSNTFINEEEGKSVLFSIPFGISKVGQGLGTIMTTICFMKVVVNCKTGDVLYMFKPGGIGTYVDEKYHDQMFKNLGKCKS